MNIDKIPFRAYKGTSPYIFVSYAHKDSDRVFKILDALHKHRYRIWYDEGIDPGNEWRDEIADALGRSTCFLLFVSKNSMVSPNVRNEICYAVDTNDGCHKICIYLEDADIPGSLKFIETFKSVNIMSGDNVDELCELIDDKMIIDDEYEEGPAAFHPDDTEWILNRMTYEDVISSINTNIKGNNEQRKEAFQLANEMAYSGFAELQMLVAIMYLEAIGTEKDLLKAHKWIKLASISGYDEGKKIVENNYKLDELIVSKYLAL